MPESANILVIDDDPSSGELTCRRLERAGFSAKYHKGPFGSLAAFQAGRYRLVILDVKMPGLSGTNLIQGLREQPGVEKPRVMLYSSLDDAALRDEALRYGADAWLSKGASRSELAAAVGELMGGPADAQG